MGNSQQIPRTVTMMNLNEWKQIGIHRETIKIVKHHKNNVLAELQCISFNPQNNLQRQLEIYQYRKLQSNALVKCLGVMYEEISSKSICSSSHVLKVLTQRIPYRLNQLQPLSFSQSLYVLIESLKGYKDCYSKLGAFSIDGEMIGINTQGEVRVWVNQNFAQNHPQMEKPFLQISAIKTTQVIKKNLLKSKEETQMVNNITKLVQKKCQNEHFPKQFKQKMYRIPLTFDEAYKTIENFVKLKEILVPDRVLSKVSTQKIMFTQTASSENFGQRITILSKNFSVSRELFNRTQQSIPCLSSSVSHGPSYQLRSHSPAAVIFQRHHESTFAQKRSNHFLEVRSYPIQSKIIFRYWSPNNAYQNFIQKSNVTNQKSQ